MNFYTNVQCYGNYIYYRGVRDGIPIRKKLEYRPKLYEPAKKQTLHTDLFGQPLLEMEFDTIRDAKDYIKQFDDVSGKPIYGNRRFEYSFIAEQHKNEVDWDQSKICIAYIDIEVGSDNGFPKPEEASEPITAICLKYSDTESYVFGCGDYVAQGRELYYKCANEYELIKQFLNVWSNRYPDIISGWNINLFDIPYIYNRITNVMGEDEARKLSPWGWIKDRVITFMGREQTAYEVAGIALIDYIDIYRKYAPGGNSQESYKLDNIAFVELGENKLSYDEYDSLHELYKQNYQKFIEYNIKDVALVERLEDKLKLIELALTLAYDSKTNYDDVFSQVRMWDVLIYNDLLKKNIIIPPSVRRDKGEAFEGAYVKDPQVGKHDWVASFDLNSLYPHLIMQYNISPEMLIEPSDWSDEMRDIISQGVNVDKLLAQRVDTSKLKGATLTPNGQFFKTSERGFLPKMMENMYEDRKVYKKKAIEAKKELELERDPNKRFIIEKRIARYNNLQLAKKVCLNSAYGALGNQYFRFFDIRQAMGITMSGQLSIRWIEAKLNGYMNKLLKTDDDYVIASDTDSIYLRLGGLVDKVFTKDQQVMTNRMISFMDKVCEEKIQPFIDKSYQELADYVGAFEQKMQMKREALADKGIWTAKKRYILNVYNNEGVQYAEPHLKVMGLEMVKSSTPAPIREKMQQSIEIMMNGTEEDIHKFIEDFRAEFKKLDPEDISFPRGLSNMRQYADKMSIYKKGTPIHAKGALIYNHYIKQLGLEKKYPLIQEGEKIKFTYLKVPNPCKDIVISYPVRLPKELNLHAYVNYDEQFNKAFIEPISVVLNCMGWSTEKRNTLESFFG